MDHADSSLHSFRPLKSETWINQIRARRDPKYYSVKMSLFRSSKVFAPAVNLLSKARFSFAHQLVDSEKKDDALPLDFYRENCILVDANDQPIGSASKRDCHKVDGDDIRLHRAFSVFLFNKDGDMLLQKRSSHKVNNFRLIFALKFSSFAYPHRTSDHKFPTENLHKCLRPHHLIGIFSSSTRSHSRIVTRTLAVRTRCTTTRPRGRSSMQSASKEQRNGDSALSWAFRRVR